MTDLLHCSHYRSFQIPSKYFSILPTKFLGCSKAFEKVAHCELKSSSMAISKLGELCRTWDPFPISMNGLN